MQAGQQPQAEAAPGCSEALQQIDKLQPANDIGAGLVDVGQLVPSADSVGLLLLVISKLN